MNSVDPGNAGTPRVIVVSTDLMDRSKFTSAFDQVEVVRSVEALLSAPLVEADTVFVDLRLVDRFSELRTITAHLVVFGSHIDRDAFDAASAVDVTMVARSKLFASLQRNPADLLP